MNMPAVINQDYIYYGEQRLYYTRQVRRGNSSKVQVKVNPSGSVIVAAPSGVNEQDVKRVVEKRSAWIVQQQHYFKSLNEYESPRQYVSGETHYYLGRQYQLKVQQDSNAPQQVKLSRGYLVVSVKDHTPEKVKTLLYEWYRERAREQYTKRLSRLLELTPWVKGMPSVRIQRMEKQWGSCSPSGNLTLNLHLIKAPSPCVDYVILHELCHIAEHNHSERFYRLLHRAMPNWEVVKQRLDSMVWKFIES